MTASLGLETPITDLNGIILHFELDSLEILEFDFIKMFADE